MQIASYSMGETIMELIMSDTSRWKEKQGDVRIDSH